MSLTALQAHLSTFLSEAPLDARRDAALAIQHTLSAAPIRVVGSLDRALRDPRSRRHLTVPLHAIDSLDLPEVAEGLLCLASVQRDGYLREDALVRLGARAGRLPLGFVLRRLNDPVAAIRERARALLPGVLHRTAPAARVGCLPLLEVLPALHAARGDDSAALDLSGLEHLPLSVLLAGITATDSEVRRAALRHSARIVQGTAAMAAPLRAGLRAPDPATRRLAATLACQGSTTPPPVRAALLPAMLHDPSPHIRQVALRVRVRDDDDEATADLIAAALDSNAGIRHLARRYLRRRGPLPDLRAQALAILAAPHPPRGALIGALGVLSELGGSADADAVRPFLEHPRAAVQREAARTLSFL